MGGPVAVPEDPPRVTASGTRARIIRLRARRHGFDRPGDADLLVAAATDGRLTTVDEAAADRRSFEDVMTVFTRLDKGPLTARRDGDRIVLGRKGHS